MADVKDILNINTEKTPSKVESILVGNKKKTPASSAKKKKPGMQGGEVDREGITVASLNNIKN